MNQASFKNVQFYIEYMQDNFAKVVITIPRSFVSLLYKRASLAQKKEIHTHGFSKGATPLSYIEQNYRASLLEHVKEFIFKYFVIDCLYKEIFDKKIFLAGEPRLYDVILVPEQDARFYFELSLIPAIDLSRWETWIFKAPKRKNYKDIDRQVESFINDEQNKLKSCQDVGTVALGDWVGFELVLVDEETHQPLADYGQLLWLKIGYEEADVPFQELFIGKKPGDSFYSNDKSFQAYFTSTIATDYLFYIHVKEIINNAFFAFDYFRHHFRLRSSKEVHQKLIEVFSFRNDLSLRRAMVEEVLKLLAAKHRFDIPNYLVLRQQKVVLEAVGTNPDYHVYKTQTTFQDNVRQLALKQVKEMLLVDQLMHKANVTIAVLDVKGYLNMYKSARTKEFIYFNLPNTKIDGQEMPITSAMLDQCCLREKTLNHVIYQLTKK